MQNITRFFIFLLAITVADSARSAGGVSISTFGQDCQALSTRSEGQNATTAKLIIRSWLEGLKAKAAFSSTPCESKCGSLSTVFPCAQDPAWCAASIEKFLADNRDSLPDDLSATDMLPLWWMSVHPDAESQHKQILQSRLMTLKDRKARATPMRRLRS
ncbi:MAG: hypothetical protein EOP86_07270 [Verrucomicrobiaceae bacterium]|nr:MAG: hypothetical protein EOP86_07270 [Verrucomicrobiaceae bacterium]